jgi:hypothetical protein
MLYSIQKAAYKVKTSRQSTKVRFLEQLPLNKMACCELKQPFHKKNTKNATIGLRKSSAFPASL